MSTLHQVIVLLGNPERGQALAQLLNNELICATAACNSDELRTLLNTRRVDAVVAEHDLRGFLTGLEILERLHAELLRPSALLLGDLNPADRIRAAGLKIAQILPASTTLDGVREAVANALLAADHASVSIPLRARTLVREADFIRPLPQVICKLMRFISDDSGSMAELAQDISVDPKITASLLKLTNSAAIGLPTKVTRVFDAVNLLGTHRTVALVLSDGLVKAQAAMLKTLPEEFSFWFHTRSVLVACTVSAFARKLHGICQDTAYLLGLFQEMGILVLAQSCTDRYLQLLERFKTVAQLQLHTTEQQQFGLTHADVSAALMQKWELPISLVSLVAAHHDDSNDASRSRVEQQFLHAMRIGEAVADLRDVLSPQRHHRLQRCLAEFGLQRADDCRASMTHAFAKAREASELFNTPLPDEAQLKSLMVQLHSAVGISVPDDFEEDPAMAASPQTGEDLSLAEDWTTDAAWLTPAAPVRPALLVIDDELVILKLVKQMLDRQGLQVFTCTTAEEARAFVPRVQAILSDIHLGMESGIDLVRQLQAEGFSGPIIMMSGDCTRSTVTAALGSGIVGFLGKPFTQAALFEKLNKHFRLAPVAAQNLKS